MDTLSRSPGKIHKDACASTHSLVYPQKTEFSQSTIPYLIMGGVFLTYMYFVWQVDFVMHVSLFLTHCNCKMGLHLQHSAVYEDAVTSEYPSTFQAAPEKECL